MIRDRDVKGLLNEIIKNKWITITKETEEFMLRETNDKAILQTFYNRYLEQVR